MHIWGSFLAYKTRNTEEKLKCCWWGAIGELANSNGWNLINRMVSNTLNIWKQPLWWARFPVAFPTSFLCIVLTEQDWLVGTLWVHIYWFRWIYLFLSMCVLIMTNLEIHFVSIPQGTNILQTAPLPFVGGSSVLLWYSNATVKLSMGMSSNRINWNIQTQGTPYLDKTRNRSPGLLGIEGRGNRSAL